MILDVRGTPMPSIEILSRLHEINPNLGLKFMPQGLDGPHWAVTYTWPENDPRRAEIRQGRVNPADAFDIYASLPPDCSADEAYGYIVRSFVSLRNLGVIGSMIDRLTAYNKKVQDNVVQTEVIELAEELAATNAPTLFKNEGKTITRVYMNGSKDVVHKSPDSDKGA